MSLSSYLASKYLTAEPSSSSTSKKRKRKTPKEPASGLIIADDDTLGWSNTPTTNEEDDTPLTVASNSAEFRKSKKNAWKVVGTPAPKPQDLDQDAAAADAIIASAAAENAAAGHQDEEPVIEDEDEDRGVVKMSDGTHAGLQTAASVTAQMEKRRREERAQWEAEERAAGRKPGAKGKHREEETVYRDATGRRIDISMRRAEARREAEMAERKEKEEKEAQMGDVQRAMKAQRREQLEEARFIPLARTADDEEMNRELKERVRWDDPAAMFLREKKEGKSVSGKPVYKGVFPPNRYGIRPGYRWDGVDRSNGWEGEIFKARNRRTRNKELDFAWQTDE
jgi:pre-mRNA-splicing factor CWC26